MADHDFPTCTRYPLMDKQKNTQIFIPWRSHKFPITEICLMDVNQSSIPLRNNILKIRQNDERDTTHKKYNLIPY